MRTYFLGLAVIAFGTAAWIDWPGTPPTRTERTQGNFACSLGFLFLSLAWMF